MNWFNVKLIFVREVRDQLRDRRTLFTIAVLPVLLYPLIGMTFLRVTHFLEEHPTRVWLLGADSLPEAPPLVEGNQFVDTYCPPEDARLLELIVADQLPEALQNLDSGRRVGAQTDSTGGEAEDVKSRTGALDNEPPSRLLEFAQSRIASGEYDAVVYFPEDFAEKLNEFRQHLSQRKDSDAEPVQTAEIEIPQPVVFVDNASDKSRIASSRVRNVIERWRRSMIEQNLIESRIPVTATQPFKVVSTDIARDERRQAAIWSKILPFVVLIWALTGAFYPAIDLCAGEKERGTLETLLSSPAERSEIVWGKLLTIMSFSIVTSLLNLLSMGLTGLFVIAQFANMSDMSSRMELGPPPLAAIGWLIVALIPASAMFSALSLAIAAFARSSKEGQYYLMPLFLISMPLLMIPMFPTAELNIGTSLIPVTGIVMLLRRLIEGQYADVLRYCIPVMGVTTVCCWLAVRWAIEQFSNENVLFRESERWGLGLWLRRMIQQRSETPTVAQAVMCGVLLLVIQFFAGMSIPPPRDWSGFVTTTLVMQIALIATPALLMTIMLTRSIRKTLLLRWPHPATACAAVMLAITLHPCVNVLGHAIEYLYPMNEQTTETLKTIFGFVNAQPAIYVVLLMALTPAICEELAFRGFILSGLRRPGHDWSAIVLSSLLFGVAHGLLQQSLAAFVVGIVIGIIAVRSGSLLPGMLFHLTHNSVAVLSGRLDPDLLSRFTGLGWLYRTGAEGELVFRLPVVILASLFSAVLIWWFVGSRNTRDRMSRQNSLNPQAHSSLHAPAK